MEKERHIFFNEFKDMKNKISIEAHDEEVNFSDFVGKTITDIYVFGGEEKNGIDEIIFKCSDKTHYHMYHEQDCCESVVLYDVDGNDEKDGILDRLKCLIGKPIKFAECVTNDIDPMELEKDFYDSFTWTFYKIANDNAFITMRWLGESNGYYSESVNLEKTVYPIIERRNYLIDYQSNNDLKNLLLHHSELVTLDDLINKKITQIIIYSIGEEVHNINIFTDEYLYVMYHENELYEEAIFKISNDTLMPLINKYIKNYYEFKSDDDEFHNIKFRLVTVDNYKIDIDWTITKCAPEDIDGYNKDIIIKRINRNLK